MSSFADLLEYSQETISRFVDFDSNSGGQSTTSATFLKAEYAFEDIHQPQTCEEVKADTWEDEELKKIALTCLFSLISMCITSSVALMMRNNK